ncbi:MAG: hypothetical protein ACOY94_13715 [Bacillota bacterium]
MKIRLGASLLALLTAATLLLLLAEVQAAHTSALANSQQSISRAKLGSASVGSTLRVYVTGDLALVKALREQLAPAIRGKELLFDEILFLDTLPEETGADPFLAIHLGDGGFWTPFYATRKVDATLRLFVGRPVRGENLFPPDPAAHTVVFGDETCVGECSEGDRRVKLETRALGLISLPAVRAHAAGKLAEEAAILVADGLPDSLNPAKWAGRAHELAQETQGVTFSSFQRLKGCRGGVVLAGSLGPGGDWRLMYYDASLDRITEVLTRNELQARFPGVRLTDAPAIGAGEETWSLYLGDDVVLTSPVGTCSLSGWRAAGS